jgi:hypothetical protein
MAKEQVTMRKQRMAVHLLLSGRLTLLAAIAGAVLAVALIAPVYAQDDATDLIDAVRDEAPTFSDSFRFETPAWELDLDSDESSLRFQSGTYRVGAIDPGIFVWGIADVFAPNLLVEVDVPRPGYFSFIDNWDENWTVRVDGKAVEIELLFGTFKSVRLDAGRHEVCMAYCPQFFTWANKACTYKSTKP